MSDTTAENAKHWMALSIETRAELLRSGVPFPSETAEEKRCRIKARLGLFDDEDIKALADVTDDTLAKKRVSGTGPRPIRIMRSIFYAADDVKDWMLRHRDTLVPATAARAR